MRNSALIAVAACGALLAWPLPSSSQEVDFRGGFQIRDRLELTDPSGGPIGVARRYTMWCSVRKRTGAVVHLLGGDRRSHWSVAAPVRYLRRHPRLRLPESLRAGAVLFAAADGNEASSAEEEARGLATFDRIGCRNGPVLRFRVN